MTLFFTSDEHYGHHNIIKYCNRPFKDTDEMNRELIARHNAVVEKDDEVIHVGDFAMSEKLVPIILPQLNGRHKLVSGNHDKCHSLNKNYEEAKKRYLMYGFVSVYEELHLNNFVINHLPYTGDGHPKDKFPNNRPKDNGSWLICGHIHNLWTIRDRMINVGVDAHNLFPITYDHLKDLISKHNLINKV